MHREGEDAGIGFKDEGRAVPVVHVQVDDGHALDSSRLDAWRVATGYVVEGAEAFAVARKGMVQPSANVTGYAKLRSLNCD